MPPKKNNTNAKKRAAKQPKAASSTKKRKTSGSGAKKIYVMSRCKYKPDLKEMCITLWLTLKYLTFSQMTQDSWMWCSTYQNVALTKSSSKMPRWLFEVRCRSWYAPQKLWYTVGIAMVNELLVMAAVEMCIGAPTAGSHNVFYVLSPTVVQR